LARHWRRLHNEELHNFYVSVNIISVIKIRRMRWLLLVARMAKIRNTINLKERDNSEGVAVDERILDYISGK